MNVAVATHGTAVAVKWGKSRERCDLSPGSASQFRELGKESGGGELSNAVMGGERGILAEDQGIGMDELLGGSLQGFDLALEGGKGGFEDALGDGKFQVFAVVEKLGVNGDELLAQRRQLRQRLPGGMCSRGGPGIHGEAVISEHAGVDAVGLGKAAFGLGEVADPQGIDDGEGDAMFLKMAYELAFVTTCGFEDHMGAGRKQGA